VTFLHDMFGELCRENGFELLDLTESMTRDYAANGRKFDTEWDAHWNEYGHRFVAQRVLEMLKP
jgi:hypothetical protein